MEPGTRIVRNQPTQERDITMASDIQLSQAVRSNLLSLQNTAEMMSRTQTRLATGNKVNSALDNPINFFTASGLNARAGELNNLQDSMSNAISTIEAADKGLTSITKMVEQMQATVRQAMSVRAENISHTDTVGAGVAALADGDTVGLNLTIDDGTAFDVTVFTAGPEDAGQPFSVQDFADAINDTARKATTDAAIPDDMQHVRASVEDGKLTIEAVGGRNITITDTQGGASIHSVQSFVSNTSHDFAGTPALALNRQNSGLHSEKRLEFAEQYNELRDQLNDLAQDASFNGINLLQDDDLKVVFNELTGAQQSKLEIEGKFVDTESLGVGKAHLWGGSYGAYNPDPLSIDFQSDSDQGGLENALAQLTGSLDTLRSLSAKLGSNLSVVEIRSNFTKDMVNTLQTGSAKLTLADTNEEGANMLALQTRQQLSSTALSLSSQADQAVLQLF